MTKVIASSLALLVGLYCCASSSFSSVHAFQSVQKPLSIHTFNTVRTSSVLFSAAPQENNEEEEPPKLILDGVEEHMNSLKSKYPTAEADYLAAARKRAEQRAESKNDLTTDKDWDQMAHEKRTQMGGLVEDDWEASAKEAGNEDSQILIPVDMSASGDDDEEPKLLL